jgi:hypothetical protein
MLPDDDERDDGVPVEPEVARTACAIHLWTSGNGITHHPRWRTMGRNAMGTSSASPVNLSGSFSLFVVWGSPSTRQGRRTDDAQTSVTRVRSRRRGDALSCDCETPSWFHVAPLPDMRTERHLGKGRFNRVSHGRRDSMAMLVRGYKGD